VDTHFHEKGISIVGDFPRQASASSTIPASHMLKEAYQNLHPALRSICGKNSFPPDDGTLLTQTIKESNYKLFAASDASYKEGRATHAWIISTGKIADITNPWFNVHGSGPVHGLSQLLSSTRGELQGIASFTIMSRLISTVCNSSCSISAICDNRGVIHKCSSGSYNSLRSHRRPNIDLNITQKNQIIPKKMVLSWVKGHADKQPWFTNKDLQAQKMSRDEIYNIW
jgi:hypothetical protein